MHRKRDDWVQTNLDPVAEARVFLPKNGPNWWRWPVETLQVNLLVRTMFR